MEPGRGFALRKSIDQYAVMYETQQMTHRCVEALLPARSLPCTRTWRSQDDRQVWSKTRTFPMEGLPEYRESPGKGPCLKGEASPVELIVIVVTRLSSGCPLQASVHVYDRDCRTVARGPKQAGTHCQKVHEERVMQKHLDLPTGCATSVLCEVELA